MIKPLLLSIVVMITSSCSNDQKLTLNSEEWFCTKTAMVDETKLVPAGKVVMPMTQSKIRCVAYEYGGENVSK